MAFYGMPFRESSQKHPAMKDRGLDNRYFGHTRTIRRDPLEPTSLTPSQGVHNNRMIQSRGQSPAGSVSELSVASRCDSRRSSSSRDVALGKTVANPHTTYTAPSTSQTASASQSGGVLRLPATAETAAMFKRFDYNGNGTLSLAEIDKAVRELWPHFDNKKAVMRAYRACDVDGDGFVTAQEFPLFLKYLSRFNGLLMVFESLDTDNDGRLSCEEFIRGKAVFGLAHRSAHEAQQLFNAIDTNRGGYVFFDELANYIAGTELNAERQLLRTQMKKPDIVRPKSEAKLEFLEMPSMPRERDLFSRLDVNRNGMLSLAELDKAVVELWPRFNNKPALMRAYKAADMNGNGFLGRREFKLFLTFLVVYANLFQRFSSMDANGDRRLSFHEFLSAEVNASRPQDELRAIFSKLDKNHGGYILFDEFCEFEARRTLEALLSQNPQITQRAPAYCPPISGLMCHFCGRKVPELDIHLPVCRNDHVKIVQALPEFLHITLPEMPLPIPTLQSQIQLYNETAQRLYQGLSVIECPECTRKFPLARFGGHFRTHNVSYDRRMQLMRSIGKGMSDVALPAAAFKKSKEDAIAELKLSLLNGFDTSPLCLFRRQMFLQSKQCVTMSATELQRLLGTCGLTGSRTVPILTCCALLGTHDATEKGNAANLLHSFDIQLSPSRRGIVERAFSSLDLDSSGVVPFKVLRDSLVHPEFREIFCRATEKAVSFREFEQVAKDLSPLFPDDASFSRLLDLARPTRVGDDDSFNVIVTLSTGVKQVVRIAVPPGSLVRKDSKSLMRRLSILGIEDVVKVELM